MKRDHKLSAVETIIAVALAAIAGLALWSTIRLCQRLASPLLAMVPEWLSLIANALIEESGRLLFAVAAAFALRRCGLERGLASLAVVSSYVVAALENASYVAAFPTSDAYWRLGYALPIHVGAAALYAIATAAPPSRSAGKRAIAVAIALIAAWAWHSGFNIVAALFPFPALPLVGTALNAVALAALLLASALRFGYRSVYEPRRI